MPCSDPRPRALIIAEAGVNHNGSLGMALQLVDAAARAGADYVKFQTFRAEALVTPEAVRAPYQTADGDSSQLEMLRRLEFTDADFAALQARCAERGIGFLSTPFDDDSIDCLDRLGMDLWKIPSGEITNLPHLRRIARLGRPVVLSTGMSTLDEVREAVEALEAAGLPRSMVTLLHCTTEYPAPMADVNLRAMQALATLGCRAVGYSDHTPGIEVAVAAAALGAGVIEKHFTLDRSLPGPDHRASLEPDELEALVKAVRNVEAALGDGCKRLMPSEARNLQAARRSIVAARPIRAGEVITEAMLACRRPATGLSPMMWDQVVGSTAPRDFAAGQPITLE